MSFAHIGRRSGCTLETPKVIRLGWCRTRVQTPLTYTLSFAYAQAEALAVQEREPTSEARAEIAEVWSWLRRFSMC